MEGCSAINLSKVLKPINASGGALYIITGLILAFAGGYFIQATLGFIIFVSVTGILLLAMFIFEFMYEAMISGNIAVIVVVITVCTLVGIGITLLIRKFARQWLICIIGAVVGVLISIAILSSVTITLPAWSRYLVYSISGLVGFLIFKNAK